MEIIPDHCIDFGKVITLISDYINLRMISAYRLNITPYNPKFSMG